MLVMLMDLLLVQLSQLAQTTTVTLTRTSQQVLISLAILILHLRLPQLPCIIIHTHTLIRLHLLNYHAHPPIRILHLIVLTIRILQPRQTCTTHIHTRMSRTIIRTRILCRLSSLMYILIYIFRMTLYLRTGLGQCQRVIVALEGQ